MLRPSFGETGRNPSDHQAAASVSGSACLPGTVWKYMKTSESTQKWKAENDVWKDTRKYDSKIIRIFTGNQNVWKQIRKFENKAKNLQGNKNNFKMQATKSESKSESLKVPKRLRERKSESKLKSLRAIQKV